MATQKNVRDLDEKDLVSFASQTLDYITEKLGPEVIHKLFADKIGTNEKFTGPKKINKRRKTENEAIPAVTNNRFEVLQEPDDDTATKMDILEESENELSKTHSQTPVISPKTAKSATSTLQTKKTPKITPIFVKETAKWAKTQALMKLNNINTTRCKLVSSGIQVDPATEQDYRRLYKTLESEKIQFFTFELKSEKKLKVVFRGIHQEITEKEILEDLKEKGYPADKITRMNNKNGFPMPMVIIEITKEYKSIYDIKDCCGLVIKVEPLRTRQGIIQCHKCQQYGHAQKNCHIDYKCLKCGENHSTHLCEKPRTTPPKCANCAGEHLSNYIRCPKNPNGARLVKYVDAPMPTTNPWHKAEEAKNQPPPPAPKTTKQVNTGKDVNTTNDDLAVTLGRMLITFNSTNANTDQKLEFLRQTEMITALFNRK